MEHSYEIYVFVNDSMFKVWMVHTWKPTSSFTLIALSELSKKILVDGPYP
jgi:hypothetical protein